MNTLAIILIAVTNLKDVQGHRKSRSLNMWYRPMSEMLKDGYLVLETTNIN